MQLSPTISSLDGVLETVFLALLLFLLFQALSVQLQQKGNFSKHEISKFLPVPNVPSWLPFIGHSLQLSRDPLGFMQDCYRKYGKMFTLRIGSTKMTVMCNRDLLNEFFSANESKLSFYSFLEATHFNRAFPDIFENPVKTIKPFVKQAFISRMTKFLDSANGEIKDVIKQFKLKVAAGHQVHDIDDIMCETFKRAIFKSLFAFELTPEIDAAFEKFEKSISNITIWSNIFHGFVIRQIFLRHTQACRDEYIRYILPHVENYWLYPEKQESAFIRTAVDYGFEEINGRKLLPQEVCQLLLGIHFTIAVTPILVSYHVIKELTRRPDLWKQLRQELHSLNDLSQILKNKTLHACIMEGIRVNANMLVLFRKTNKHSQLGSYYLGDTDTVGVAGALLFEMQPGEEVFSEAGEFKPERFLRENKPESMDSKSIYLWGSGVHACTGRTMSLNIIKMFVAHFVAAFDAEVVSISKKKYSANPLALQDFKLKLTPVIT